MKKNYILLFQYILTFFLCITIGHAQVNLYTQNFEGPDFDTYQLLNSGNNAVAFAVNGNDYIRRADPAILPLGNAVTGFSGNVIAFEDIDGAGFNGQHRIETNAIDITGATGLTLSIRAAAARGSVGDRYEAEDILQVLISIDNGTFQNIINMGGLGIVGDSNRNFYYDDDINGINVGDPIIDQNSQVITVPISTTGNSMVIRVVFNSDGSNEEILFDDISVNASSVLSIDNLNISDALSIYPNPSNGIITIQNSGTVLQNAIITDINGRTIASYNLEGVSRNMTLNMSSVLTSGIYFMKITSETASTVKRIVIK